MGFWGLGFRIWGLGFRVLVWGFWFWVRVSGSKKPLKSTVWENWAPTASLSVGFRVWGLGFRISLTRIRGFEALRLRI